MNETIKETLKRIEKGEVITLYEEVMDVSQREIIEQGKILFDRYYGDIDMINKRGVRDSIDNFMDDVNRINGNIKEISNWILKHGTTIINIMDEVQREKHNKLLCAADLVIDPIVEAQKTEIAAIYEESEKRMTTILKQTKVIMDLWREIDVKEKEIVRLKTELDEKKEELPSKSNEYGEGVKHGGEAAFQLLLQKNVIDAVANFISPILQKKNFVDYTYVRDEKRARRIIETAIKEAIQQPMEEVDTSFNDLFKSMSAAFFNEREKT